MSMSYNVSMMRTNRLSYINPETLSIIGSSRVPSGTRLIAMDPKTKKLLIRRYSKEEKKAHLFWIDLWRFGPYQLSNLWID